MPYLWRVSGEKQLWGPTLLLWLFSLSIIGLGCLPELPETGLLLGAYVALALVLLIWPRYRPALILLAASLAGAGWGLWSNQKALQQRLPIERHGSDHLLRVQIVSLPEIRSSTGDQWGGSVAGSVRFQAVVLGTPADTGRSPVAAGSLLYLTWYRVDADTLPRLRGDSRWLLPVRLMRPRGSVNPHSFDFEQWLLQRGIYATGYVRPGDATPLWLGRGTGIASLRGVLRDRLHALPVGRTALISALLLGDRSGLVQADRDLLKRTGTAHLLAISGLHVGMVAGFLLLFGHGIARGVGILTGTTPAVLPVVLALAGTLIYTLLAGAPLSAQRALVMTWVLLLGWHWRRRIGAGIAFALALALVLALQPLAFYAVGFWLSFSAVAALLLGFRGRLALGPVPVSTAQVSEAEAYPAMQPLWLTHILQLLRSQWLVALGLILPSAVFFSGFSAGGMLFNLVAIPWLGVLILPVLMLGALLMETALGLLCFRFAGWQLDLLIRCLETVDRLLPSWQTLAAPHDPVLLAVAALGVLVLLLPRGWPGRKLGWLFLLPLLQPLLPLSMPERQGFHFTALDVGQGLALVFYSSQAHVVYDAGPLSSTGWNAGSAIVVPHLAAARATTLDALIVSHGDRDHAGGVQGVLKTFLPERLFAPGRLVFKLAGNSSVPTEPCVAGRSVSIGDITIDWLWPQGEALSGTENDHSCVALVQWREVRLLLTGDISSAVESHLQQRYPDFPPVDLLVAPHHGSRTSSSTSLLVWSKPKRVVFSAGFRHHFGHPHAEVVERYRTMGTQIFNTAQSGAVAFTWREGIGQPQVNLARSAARFWYAGHSDGTGHGRGLSRRE
ncbi:DNA internalization-related competence protein ComEC/Rec2 [Microbulbifer spongiae]|uniref:DNA internalization-related competence protein ComEC/Rec2 n=1 Tax=Microbulbifer spongiae TaxID=2944933 RepID=A0ABY9EFQ4_9GAMM|nr:DNA internalization-related competence protein ComEC/Rec2 [Microbulbifer sp. MI-G]WKD51340.1 DNA internalization-related competence protein ComEC/Rec2 [Microbulbifer sp. MI-G]